jgi:hypothetical protein
MGVGIREPVLLGLELPVKSSTRGYLLEFRHWHAWRSLGYRIWHRSHNRWMDFRARLAGACNDDGWSEERSDYAGYSHWRCGKARGHSDSGSVLDGSHRSNNYIWDDGQTAEYAPIPVMGIHPHQRTMDEILPFRRITNYRHGIDTLRRTRLRAAMYERKFAEQRKGTQ